MVRCELVSLNVCHLILWRAPWVLKQTCYIPVPPNDSGKPAGISKILTVSHGGQTCRRYSRSPDAPSGLL
jgi:hypothetical protein